MSKNRLQVLLSTMNQTDTNIVQKMNIKTDVIVVNQADRNEIIESINNGMTIKMYSLNERGVGLSRNTALMRADGDICLFADDDVVYYDGYDKTITSEFEQHPNADVIVFNVPSTCKDPKQKDYIAKKWKKLHLFNCFRHGTFRIAVRRNAILKENISFSLLFGGGAKYSAGEDSLFLSDCIKKKLKVYETNKVIGEVSHIESTWFHGYTEKYFIDKGAFYACYSDRLALLWCLQFAIRRKKLYHNDMSFIPACRNMLKGIRSFHEFR